MYKHVLYYVAFERKVLWAAGWQEGELREGMWSQLQSRSACPGEFLSMTGHHRAATILKQGSKLIFSTQIKVISYYSQAVWLRWRRVLSPGNPVPIHPKAIPPASVLSRLVVSNFVTLCTVASSAPLSVEFSKQEYRSGLLSPLF